MTDTADLDEISPTKASKRPLIIGLILAVIGGGGGFYAVQSGTFSKSGDAEEKHAEPSSKQETPDVAFVPLDPLVISLPRSGSRAHLRFAAQLEVNPAYVDDVELLKPRIVDVLNGYLRAVELAELEDPAALVKLRGQMLRRVQIVTGEDRVRDFLVMEFVLN